MAEGARATSQGWRILSCVRADPWSSARAVGARQAQSTASDQRPKALRPGDEPRLPFGMHFIIIRNGDGPKVVYVVREAKLKDLAARVHHGPRIRGPVRTTQEAIHKNKGSQPPVVEVLKTVEELIGHMLRTLETHKRVARQWDDNSGPRTRATASLASIHSLSKLGQRVDKVTQV